MATPRLFLLSPAVIFRAQINMATVTYPLQEITVDNVTIGAITDVLAGQTIVFGSAPGLDDLGRGRVRADAAGSTIKIGRSSRGTRDGECDIANNVYVETWWDHRIWSKTPYITVDGDNNPTVYKDADVDLDDNTLNPPPVALMGPARAGTIDAGTSLLRLQFPPGLQNSFATADGATIASYSWGLPPGATLVAGYTLTDDNIEVDFDAGFYWVSLTVVDSNGKSHKTRRPVFARDPDNDPSITGFHIESRTISPTEGQRITVRILEPLPAADYPDGTLAIIFEGEPTDADPLGNLEFWGWHQTDEATIAAGRTATLRDVRLNLVDVAGRLDSLPGFPQVVERKDAPTSWMEMAAPTLDKYMHYLLHWHSTALELADWTWTGTGDAYAFVRLRSDGQSLWQQVSQRARAFTPDYRLTCNLFGQLAVVPDPMVAEDDYRLGLQIQATLDASEWSDIRYTHQRPPRVHWLWGEAILADADPEVDEEGNYVIGTAFCVAPGLAPGQGDSEQTAGERLAQSQDDLNKVMGHHYARMNAPQSALTITLPEADPSNPPWRFIDPAQMEWVRLTIPAELAAQRGLAFTAARGVVTGMSVRYDYTRTGLVRTTELTWERETSGPPAVTYVPPVADEAEGGDPSGTDPTPPLITVPPDYGLIDGQDLMAGIGLTDLYRTADFTTVSGSGGPTWEAIDLTGSEEILSWVVDPFSPGYIEGVGAINGWVVTATDIYRVADLFGTVSVTSVHAFAVALGTSSVPAQEWRSIQASFGAYFDAGVNPWLLVVSYYRDASGHEGTWALRSLDGGVTWAAEAQITAHYDTGTDTEARPIAVYTSPKTPGYALAAAYSATDYLAPATGYVSADWGATWTVYSGAVVDDPAAPLPRWAIWDVQNDAFDLGALSGSGSVVAARKIGPGAPSVIINKFLLLAPPKATKRIEVSGSWSASLAEQPGGTGGAQGAIQTSIGKSAAVSWTEDFTGVSTTTNGAFGGDFTATYTFAGGDFPLNTENIISAPPPTTPYTDGIRFQAYVSALTGSGLENAVTVHASFNVRVTEIELDDGTIYTPPLAVGVLDFGNRLGGDLHVPWAGNSDEGVIYHGRTLTADTRQMQLRRLVDGIVADISPNDGARDYGLNAYGFRIRADDSDRDYVLASVTGNDTTGASSGDYQGVYVSSNGGDTWTAVVSPVNSTSAYAAAFAGDDFNDIYIWGPAGYFGYSSNLGASVDSRAGNLGTLGASAFRGICGGPI